MQRGFNPLKHWKGHITPSHLTQLQQRQINRRTKKYARQVYRAQVIGMLTGLSVVSCVIANMTEKTSATFVSQQKRTVTLTSAHDFPSYDNSLADGAVQSAQRVLSEVSAIATDLGAMTALTIQQPQSVASMSSNNASNTTDQQGLRQSAVSNDAPSHAASSEAAKLLADMERHLVQANAELLIAQSFQHQLDDIMNVDMVNYQSAGPDVAASYRRVFDWASAADKRAQNAVASVTSVMSEATQHIQDGKTIVQELQTKERQLAAVAKADNNPVSSGSPQDSAKSNTAASGASSTNPTSSDAPPKASTTHESS